MQKTLSLEHEQIGVALILFAAGLSFALSILLWFGGDREAGIFVGLWVPSILSLASFVRMRGR